MRISGEGDLLGLFVAGLITGNHPTIGQHSGAFYD